MVFGRIGPKQQEGVTRIREPEDRTCDQTGCTLLCETVCPNHHRRAGARQGGATMQFSTLKTPHMAPMNMKPSRLYAIMFCVIRSFLPSLFPAGAVTRHGRACHAHLLSESSHCRHTSNALNAQASPSSQHAASPGWQAGSSLFRTVHLYYVEYSYARPSCGLRAGACHPFPTLRTVACVWRVRRP